MSECIRVWVHGCMCESVYVSETQHEHRRITAIVWLLPSNYINKPPSSIILLLLLILLLLQLLLIYLSIHPSIHPSIHLSTLLLISCSSYSTSPSSSSSSRPGQSQALGEVSGERGRTVFDSTILGALFACACWV